MADTSGNLVLRFDMRRAPFCEESDSDRYSAVIEMAEFAEANHFDVVGLSEHHDTEDGFLSSPLQLASMIVARTNRVRVSVSALLVPLHDPLKLAEDITLIDLVARGRFTATCGLGYREQEYERFGIDWGQRGRVFDEKLSVIVPALKGESFYYNSGESRLNPSPVSPIQGLLLIGGNSKAAARRAAKFGLLFSPAIDDPELEKVYLQACKEHGVDFAFTIFPREPSTTFISEDPQKSWKELGEFLLYDATAYGKWHHPTRRAYAESFASNLKELKSEGKYRILSPEQAVEVIQTTGSLHLAPLCGGTPIDLGWESLHLFRDKVLPHLNLQ